MSRSLLTRWFGKSADVRCRRTRLTVQPLEDRTVPTIFWNGLGGDNVLTNPSNWVGGVMPTAADDAVIGAAFAGQNISTAVDFAANSLTCASSLTANSCSLQLGLGMSSIGGALNVSGGKLNVTSATSLSVAGALSIAGASVSGMIDAKGGGSLSGTVTISTGSLNLAVGKFTLASGLSETGPGTIRVESGATVTATTFTLNSGSFSIDVGTSVSLTQFTQYGDLTGGGDLTVTQKLLWFKGTESGTGKTIVPTGSTASANGFLIGRTLTNSGMLSTGLMYLDQGAVITNQASGVWTAANDINRNSNIGSAQLTNWGTLQIAGGFQPIHVTFRIPFSNIGTIQPNPSPSGSTLTLNSNSISLDGSVGSVGVTQTLEVAGGNATIGNVLFGAGETLLVSGGAVNIPAGVQVAIPAVQQDGGTLGGAGNLSISNRLIWTNGTEFGSGTTSIGSKVGVQLSPHLVGSKAIVSSRYVDGRQIVSGGATYWTAGAILMDDGATWTNLTGASFEAQANASIARNTGVGTAEFINNGTFRVSSATSVLLPLTNSPTATVEIHGGRLNLDGEQIASGRLYGDGAFIGSINNSALSLRPGGSLNQLSTLGNFTVIGDYSQSTVGELRLDLDGKAPGTLDDRLTVSGHVALAGSLVASVNYAAQVGDSFTILDNKGTDPVSGTFAGLPEGSSFSANGATVKISYHGGDGNDVTLTVVSPPVVSLPQVIGVQINDGSVQRSMITSVRVTFNSHVSFNGPVANALFLINQRTSGSVTLTTVADDSGLGTVVALGFIGGSVELPSLADGRYNLTVIAANVSNSDGPLDGNGDGTGGDNYVLAASGSAGIFRLFGASSGDAVVEPTDFIRFRAAFGTSSAIFDYDGNGTVNLFDFLRFRPEIIG